MEQPVVHNVPVQPLPSQVTFDQDYESHSSDKTPIVIDNGAFALLTPLGDSRCNVFRLGATDFRYGWATSKIPYTSPNLVAKYRERKNNKLLLLFGNAVEIEGASRLATKSTWEGDILSNPDALVCCAPIVLPSPLKLRCCRNQH